MISAARIDTYVNIPPGNTYEQTIIIISESTHYVWLTGELFPCIIIWSTPLFPDNTAQISELCSLCKMYCERAKCISQTKNTEFDDKQDTGKTSFNTSAVVYW